VNLDAGVPVRGIESILHPVSVGETGAGRRTIQLRDQETLPNRDFILRYTTAGEQLQTALLASGDGAGGGHFTLILQPPATAAEEAAREIIFVIDQSGSQSGWPIRKAKETMRYLIHRMNPDDTFQLLGFNLAVNACFAAPVHNTPENVAKALRFLQPLEGEGGTDILQALDFALKQPDSSGRRRLICYLTDGYIGDDMQLLAYLRKHRARAHVFPFGIGNSVNRFVINGMAREGHGVAEFVTLNGSAEEAAARFYRRVAKPLLVEIGADWNGLPVEETYPRAIPDLFLAGQPVILKGRYTRAAAGNLTLRGALAGRPWSQTIRINFPAAPQAGSPLATLWAREKIEDLQSRDWLGEQWGRPNPAIEREIVATALQYRLMSQHTSFVAVEERVVNLGGRQRRVEVPVELPEGVAYDGIFGSAAPATTEREQIRAAASVRLADPMRVIGSAPAQPGLASGRSGDTLEHFGTGRGYQTSVQFEDEARLNGDPYSTARREPWRSATAPPLASAAPPPPARADGRGAGPPPAFLDGHARLERQLSELAVGAAASKAYAGPVFGPPSNAPGPAVPSGEVASERARAAARGPRLSPDLQQQVERLRASGPKPAGMVAPGHRNERVTVQLWVKELTAPGLKRLKELGFDLAATLIPGRLVLGTLPVDRLEQAAGLDFVRRIEPPRYLDEAGAR
jgi:hypothetical protein